MALIRIFNALFINKRRSAMTEIMLRFNGLETGRLCQAITFAENELYGFK